MKIGSKYCTTHKIYYTQKGCPKCLALPNNPDRERISRLEARVAILEHELEEMRTDIREIREWIKTLP